MKYVLSIINTGTDRDKKIVAVGKKIDIKKYMDAYKNVYKYTDKNFKIISF